jgi:hypothetical protein
MKKLNVSGGGRKRARQCVAAAIGHERVEDVVIERVCLASNTMAHDPQHSGLKTLSKLTSALDVFVKVSVDPNEGGNRWWTRGDRWIQKRLNRQFAEASLPECVLKHCRAFFLTTSAVVSPPTARQASSAPGTSRRQEGEKLEKALVGEKENYFEERARRSELNSKGEGHTAGGDGDEQGEPQLGAWRSELEVLRHKQAQLEKRMASLRSQS